MKTQGQHKTLELRLQERLAQLERENTELRWENQVLRTSEARYRSCFENSPISIIFIAADGRPVEANRAFEQQYGMTIAQLSDRNFNIFNDPQLIENGTLPYMQRALAGETVMEPMTYYDAGKTVPGGRFHWGQGLYYPIWDETGTVREIVEMAFDHTQQVEAQQACLHERERTAQEQLAELAQVNQKLRQRDRILEATATAANALLTVENFDEAVNTALQIIGESLDTDRVTVIENCEFPSESPIYWRILYEWDSPDTVSQISHPELAQGSYEGIEQWYALHQLGQGISCLLEEMPEPFRSGMEELGVKALNAVPIFVEGKYWGCVGFDDCREAKRRSAAELAVLRIAADCIGSAIHRDRIRRERDRAERQVLLEQEKATRERVVELAKANEALKKTLDCLAAQPELDTFLGQVLMILVEQLGGSGGSFWFFGDDELDTEPQIHLDYDRGQIKTTAQTQHPGAIPRRPCNEQERQLWQKLRHGKQFLIHDDIANDPALEYYRSHLMARGIKSILVMPLVLCDRLIGAFSIRSTQKQQYQPEELELAQALAQQVTLAIQLTRLAEQSREAAILEERNRMAQEIHDTLAQAFTGILMQLQAAARYGSTQAEQASSCIARAQDLAREGLAEARRSVWYLYQSDTQDHDLLHALTRITEQLTAETSVQAQVYVQGTPYSLNPEVGMNLLRIGQESLTNALRHAQAQTIQIDLTYDRDRIQLRVWDDGRGFDLQHQTSNGFGLKGMQQRCDRIGACLEINTQLGAGTEIIVIALQKVKS